MKTTILSRSLRARVAYVFTFAFAGALSFSSFAAVDPSDYKKKVTFALSSDAQTALGAEALTDFPLPIRLSTGIADFSYGDFNFAGEDVAFEDDAGNTLEFELDTWDTTGTSVYWVKVPSLTAATTVTCYYGAAAATTHDPKNVWTKYVAVIHGGTTLKDSSPKQLTVAAGSADTTGTASGGLLGGGIAKSTANAIGLNLANPYDVLTSSGIFSVSGWWKRDGNGGNNNGTHILAGTYTGWDTTDGFVLLQEAGTRISIMPKGRHQWSTGNYALADMTWGHVAFAYSKGVKVTSYFNGMKDNEATSSVGVLDIPAATTPNWSFGSYANTASKDSLKGYMDELRVYDGLASGTWMKAEYLFAESDQLSNGGASTTDPTGVRFAAKPTIEKVGSDFKVRVRTASDSGTGGTLKAITAAIESSVTNLVTDSIAAGTEYVETLTDLAANTSYRAGFYGINATGTEVTSFATNALYNGTLAIAKGSDSNPGNLTIPARVIVSRADTYGDLIVRYTVDSTGTEGTHYQPLSGVVVITNGATSATVEIYPAATIPNDCTVTITLTDGLYFVNDAAKTATVALKTLNLTAGFEKKIVFTVSYATGSTLADFPALVRLSTSAIANFSYGDFQLPNGGDLRFVTEDGATALAHEIEKWDESGESLVWVKVPSFAEGQKIIAYYGNPTPWPVTAANTWTDYAGVWHLNETTAGATTIVDAAGNGNGTSHTKSLVVDGVFGKARGRTDATAKNGPSVTVSKYSALDALTPTFTVSVWVKPTTLSSDWAYVFSRKEADTTASWGLQFRGSSGNTDAVCVYSSGVKGADGNQYTTSGKFAANTWVKYDVVYEQTQVTFYLNGVSLGAQTIKPSGGAKSGSLDFTIGGLVGTTGYGTMKGYFDETRLRNGTVSADWIKAEYDMQNGTDVFSNGGAGAVDASAIKFTAKPTIERDGDVFKLRARTTAESGTGTIKAIGVASASSVTNLVTAAAAADTEYVYTLTGLTADKGYTAGFYAVNAKGTETESFATNYLYNGTLAIAAGASGHESDVTKPATITVSRADTYGDLVVNYTAGGTAVAGTHYTALPGSIVIPDGATSATIEIYPIRAETEHHTVQLALGDGLYFTNAASSATITIYADTNPANWKAGDEVVVAAADTIKLTNATPLLKSITIGGTLVMSNWTTRLNAETVTIANGGTVTCAGPFWDREVQRKSDSAVFPIVMSNRVWITATSALTIEQGGKIDVNGLGYGCPFAVATYAGVSAWCGFGPCRSSSSTVPSVHGGAAGSGYALYGDPAWPTAPGSSGGGQNADSFIKRMRAPGGGAVYLDCPTAVVTIRGTISANGYNGSYVNDADKYAGTAGTGGSVLIDAKRLVTDGAVITANGGNASGNGGYSGQPGSTGGRIALKYDASAQQAGDIGATTKVWAAPEHNKVFSTCCYDNSTQWSRPGTVWVPDAMTLSTLLASGSFSGEPIVGTGDGCVTVSSINLTSGYLVFGNSLTNLTVTGDVNLNGNDVRLCFGANTWVRDYTFTSPDVPFTLAVGGDFNLTLGARADLFAAPTNGLGVARGAFVNVTGDFNVLGRAKDDALGLDERITYVYPACNPTNGAGVRISAKNVTVNEKGRISSELRGFAVNVSANGQGRGPGAGRSYNESTSKCWGIGAGHGGRGGHGSKASGYDVYGIVYDDSRRPMLAGSSGTKGGATTGSAGGGIVHLVANNLMTLAGILSADSGWGPGSNTHWQDGTAGSGGSILLEASKFSAAATASVTAKGGSATYDCSAGAGGCISVWIGAPGCGFDEVKSYAALETSEVFGAATVSVAPGSGYNYKDEGEFFAAEAGTVTAYQATPLGQNLIVQTYDEASFGTTEPAYGAHAVSVGATATVTATDVVRADNIRSRATGYTIETLNEDGTWSAPVAYEGSVCSFEMDEKTYRVTWKWTLEAKLTLETAEHGSVTPSAPPKDEGWYALGSTATLTPAAESGYGFAYWTGVPHVQIQESPCLLVMDAAKTVTPHFQATPAGGQSFVWSGAGGNKLWLNPSNWTPNGLPIAGDRVSFPETASASAFMVLLDAATAPLSSLTVPANVTLMTTNWMTKIVAGTVTVQNGGTVTCAGPFADRVTAVVPEIQMSNRVWIVCTDLTVDAGGKIDVTAKGFGDNTVSKVQRSYGPGRSNLDHKSASSHGGLGKNAGNDPYGSVDEPEEPGSSGGGGGSLSSYPSVACAGGGAIRIDATGTVTVNGAVTANGRQSTDYMGAGSGGSVLIYAQKIAANGGTISAKGGQNTGPRGTYGAAGGRVALHYDAVTQQTAALDDLTIDVGPGQRIECNYPGTLWTTDNQLLKFLNDGKIAAEIVVGHEGKVTFDALTINATDVRFGGEVTNVTVLGDMRMTGASPRFAFGAEQRVTGYAAADYAPFTSAAGCPFVLNVGGNLLMEAGSFVEFHAAPTNGLGEAFGGYVKVGGRWTIANGATVYTRCERNTGAAFSFAARNMTIETNAVLSADYSGFPGAVATKQMYGFGPGRGYSWDWGQGNGTVGASYGGVGGSNGTVSVSYGQIYGDANRPMLAGSSGAPYNYSGTGNYDGVAGGGFIHLDVSGRLTIGGTVTANGAKTRQTGNSGGVYSYGTGASGGAILIDAHKLTLEPGAVLSVKGGNNDHTSSGNSVPAGGGGRIAVWLGSHWTPSYRLRAYNILDPANVIPEGVTVTAAGGVTPKGLRDGGEGTIRFINCVTRGMAIIIR